MKRFLLCLFAVFALLGLPAVSQVSIDASKTGTSPFAGTYTWAGKPSTAANGTLAFVTDLGDGGNYAQYSTALTRWRPLNGSAVLKNASASGNVANSETIVMQALIPAATLAAGDVLRFSMTTSKSGTTDTCGLTVRLGTAGTTSDSVITGFSAFGIMAASGVAGGGVYDIRVVSATSVQKMGNATTNNASYSGTTGTGAIAAATTGLTDSSANALYLSIGILSSGATNTCALTSGQIQWVTS